MPPRAYEPVRPWTWRIRTSATAPAGRRPTIEVANTGATPGARSTVRSGEGRAAVVADMSVLRDTIGQVFEPRKRFGQSRIDPVRSPSRDPLSLRRRGPAPHPLRGVPAVRA